MSKLYQNFFALKQLEINTIDYHVNSTLLYTSSFACFSCCSPTVSVYESGTGQLITLVLHNRSLFSGLMSSCSSLHCTGESSVAHYRCSDALMHQVFCSSVCGEDHFNSARSNQLCTNTLVHYSSPKPVITIGPESLFYYYRDFISTEAGCLG